MEYKIPKEELLKLLDDGVSIREIARRTGIHRNTICYYAHRYELDEHISSYKNKVNREDIYLEKIDTKEKAYILGFILGDGSIRDDYLSISVQLADKEILEFFSKELDVEVKISTKLDKKKRIFPHAGIHRRLPHMLKHLGGPLKQDRHFPRVPVELEPYLLRGLFEADGCLSWGYRKDKGRENKRMWHFISINHHLKCLLGVQQLLYKKLNLSTVVRPCVSKDFLIRFDGKDNVIKFLNYIYQDRDFMVLHRKYNKYIAMCLELGEFGEGTENQ